MKINKAFVLRNISGKYLLIPYMKNDVLNTVVSLNNTAALIFLHCHEVDTPEKLAQMLSNQYIICKQNEIDKMIDYIKSLIENKFLEE